jgi:hypothetical protein
MNLLISKKAAFGGSFLNRKIFYCGYAMEILPKYTLLETSLPSSEMKPK